MGNQCVRWVWFLQQRDSGPIGGRTEVLGYSATRGKDCRNYNAALIKLIQKIEPRHSIKIHVDHDETGWFGMRVDKKRCGRGVKTRHKAVALQEHAERIPDRGIIFDDEDCWECLLNHRCASSPLR